MESFLARGQPERAALIEQTGDEIGLAADAVEKDFRVCWALRTMFRLEAGPHLAFKGGTSLSKCYGVIERFSEDIDVVIGRDFLGFGEDRSPEAAGSGNERKRRVEAVFEASRRYVGEQLLPELREAVRAQLEAGRIQRVGLDPDAEDQQAILIEYATVLQGSTYLRPVVKLELGARSDVEPNEDGIVRPYLARHANHGLTNYDTSVRVVAPERTFWEKVCLLHEEAYRADGPKPRLARHYYDLWCLDRGEIAERAITAPGLLERVTEHRRTFFRMGGPAQQTLERGTIRLIPTEQRMPAWKSDFDAMRDTMFFHAPPAWSRIIDELRPLERRINAALSATSKS